MLINAGYLATTQGGLLGKGLKIRKEDLEVIPGQWKQASASDGSTIKDNIFPFDYKPPSRELLELLQYIIHQGELLTSTSEVMSGQGETQNVSPSTIAQMISQGLKTY